MIEKIKQHALQIGFCDIGVTKQHAPTHYKHYLDWVNKGYHQNMWYLAEDTRKKKRENAKNLLPDVNAIFVGAVSYNQKQPQKNDIKFARYGWGLDYHDFVKQRFEQLATFMKVDLHLDFESKIVVDTAPILEREFASLAGVGWVGKNTMIMNQKNGSYLYLGLMLTTLNLPEDQPTSMHCGTCTACLDACPTDAIEEPYMLNPQKCISYHTIENQDEDIPSSIKPYLQGWVAGCDICQEVCPWNNKAEISTVQDTHAKSHVQLNASDVLAMDEKTYRELFRHTSFSRIGFQKLQKNVKSALEKDPSATQKPKKE